MSEQKENLMIDPFTKKPARLLADVQAMQMLTFLIGYADDATFEKEVFQPLLKIAETYERSNVETTA